MAHDIKIAFFDFDGTLYDHFLDRICPKTVEALIKLKENGFKLSIATGRPIMFIEQLKHLTDRVEFDYIICSNGQSIIKNNEIIYQKFLDKGDVNRVLKYSLDNDVALGIVTRGSDFVTKMNEDVKFSFDCVNLEYPQVIEATYPFEEDVEQLVVYGRYDLKKQYESLLNHTKTTSWGTHAFDFVPDNGLKVHGIEKVLEMEGLTKHQAIAFGDGENDLEMIGYVEIGVALGNANPLLLNVADVVTDHISQEGLYNALVRLELI